VSPETSAALDIARRLAAAGVPIFIAQPDASVKTGYKPPPRWERTVPDPAVADLWRPGLALCAVMGCGLDLVDFDPRSGGDPAALGDLTPLFHALAATPSGGAHGFIASLGVGSRDNILPGIDVKGGNPDGSSRGFAFIAPTVRVSVVTGEPAAYRWVQAPALERLQVPDASGERLAARIRELRAAGDTVRRAAGAEWWQQFMANREPQSEPAAKKAIDDKLAEVRDWKPDSGAGFRATLLRAALTLGGYVGGFYLDETLAHDLLEKEVSAVWGSPDTDDQLWIRQGLEDGRARPFQVFSPADERTRSVAAQAVAQQGEDGPSAVPPWTVFEALGTAPFDPAGDSSDQGLAKAVANRMYPALRYAGDAGLWVKRERDVWTECGGDMSSWIVSLLADLMPLGNAEFPSSKADYTEAHWQAKRRGMFMSSAGTGKVGLKLRAIIQSDHPASIRLTDLDTNPDVLWAGGVPWDLRASGDVPVPAAWIDPNTPHLRSALCAPSPAVPTPLWDAYLAAVLPDPEVRAWALRVLSVAITGRADAVLPILWGKERSGKTSLIEMLIEVLGSYAHAANPKLLNAQDNSHDAIIYALKGRRLSFIDEGPRRGHDATERLKQLTGGAPLEGRAMRANPVSFKPSHTLVMTTNPEPSLTDPALRARVRLIPCNSDEADVRPHRIRLLGRALHAEAPGILAALMREAAAYLADPDTATTAAAPVSIRGLAKDLADQQDPVAEWVELCTVPTDPGTPGRTLHRAFAEWHQAQPLHRRSAPPTENAFGRRLTELGYPKGKVNGAWYRPLSVLNGWTGRVPQPPTPGGFMADSGGSVAHLAGQSARPDNPSSGAVLLDTSGGLADSSVLPATDLKKTGGEENQEGSREKSANRQRPASNGGLASANGSGGSGLADPPESASESARAGSRTAARQSAKVAERDAARAAAAGEPTPLPVMVNRAGEVTPLTALGAGQALGLALVRAGGELTVDVEHTGYPVGHADYALRTVQLGDEQAAVVLDPADPEQAEVIRAALAGAPVLHAHSATADLVPLVHAGLTDESAWDRMHDTVIPAKLADPQSTGSDPDLKHLAANVLGEQAVALNADRARAALFKVNKWLEKTEATTPLERSGWAQVDPACATMEIYAASDVLDTAALAARLPQPLPGLVKRERAVQRITARVTHRGLPIDHDRVQTLTGEHRPAMAAAAEEMRTLGVADAGSDRQLAQRLGELGVTLPRTKPSSRFPEGQPSVAAGVLEALRETAGTAGELISAVLDYRHHETVLGLFLEPYRVLCEFGDGRARPTVYTLGTDTGRMSCVRPNLQQLPREGGVRSCITADPGHKLISADFNGVEIRVMAALSQDPSLVHMLIEGAQAEALVASGQMTKREWQARYDLHARVAEIAFGPGWTKGNRYTAKRGVFGWAYGGSVPSLARQIGVPEHVMSAIVDSLRQVAPGYVGWADEVKKAVRRGHTQMPTYAGRIIHLPREYPHKAPNYCIQGTARELLVDALLKWDQTPWGGGVVLPVHDEIVAMVPEQDADEAMAALVSCMSSELYGIPIVAEAGTPAFAWQDSA
jgi:P4 family phage/plasmid primase-like protien